jgi:predicted  nucleic acid-binding Zn-ribbon protein
MSKQTDAVDLYLAIKASGCSKNDFYDVIDMCNNNTVRMSSISDSDDTSNLIHNVKELVNDLQDQIKLLNTELEAERFKTARLQDSIASFTDQIEKIKDRQEEIKYGSVSPERLLLNLNKQIAELEKEIDKSKPWELDKITQEWHKLALKKESFRTKIKVKDETVG